jgi:hypothetical protein
MKNVTEQFNNQMSELINKPTKKILELNKKMSQGMNDLAKRE